MQLSCDLVQSLRDIRALLETRGLHPRHALGQNFLHDQNHMRRIVEAGGIEPGDLVLEVGAGTGSLTESLLEAGARVVAVEIDESLAPILRDRLSPFGEQVRLFIGDVLSGKHTINADVLALLDEVGRRPCDPSPADQTWQTGHAQPPATSHQPPPFKLIANLPYQIASPLLANLVMDVPSMKLAVVMVQREVADRLTAGPGHKQFGQLGVLVQALSHVERLANLPPSCFWPQPKVGSAVVRLRRREQPLTDDPHRLSALLHKLFSQRRKQLGRILGRDTPLPEGIEPTARPEQLSVAQLVALGEQTER